MPLQPQIGLRLHQTKLLGRRINVEFTQVAGKKKDKIQRRIRALSKKKNPPEKTWLFLLSIISLLDAFYNKYS